MQARLLFIILLYSVSCQLKVCGQTVPAADNSASDYETLMIKAGLKDVQSIDSSIKVKLAYAGTDNFMKRNIYGNLVKAYLLPHVCQRLVLAQKNLKKKHPLYSLIVLDAGRPYECQKMLWDLAPLGEKQKTLYIAHPSKISLHNYGSAVDVAIVDENNKQLDFGTAFDFFGPESQPQKETELLKKGRLTRQQVNNRKLLREVMMQAGFTPIKTEWWHFNAGSREKAKTKYKLIR